MANVSVAEAKTATLSAATADTITFSGNESATKCEIVNLSTTSTDVIWARCDGTAATVAGTDCVPIPANSSWRPPATITTLSLIAAATPQYCVNRIVS